jgi:hypothetical protein
VTGLLGLNARVMLSRSFLSCAWRFLIGRSGPGQLDRFDSGLVLELDWSHSRGQEVINAQKVETTPFLLKEMTTVSGSQSFVWNDATSIALRRSP